MIASIVKTLWIMKQDEEVVKRDLELKRQNDALTIACGVLCSLLELHAVPFLDSLRCAGENNPFGDEKRQQEISKKSSKEKAVFSETKRLFWKTGSMPLAERRKSSRT